MPPSLVHTHPDLFPLHYFGSGVAFKGARKHARQPQLFLINHPQSVCQGSTCGLGGYPQAHTATLHLQVKDAQSARVNCVIRIEPKTGLQMFRQSAAGCRHLLPVFRESFSVSQINFCRSSLASTYVHGDGQRTAHISQRRLGSSADASRGMCAVARLHHSFTHRSGSNLPGFGLL